MSRKLQLTSICLQDGSDGTFVRMREFDSHSDLYGQSELHKEAWQLTVIPPADFCLKTTSGLFEFRRIPTASSSISNIFFCSVDFVASTACQLQTSRKSSGLTH
jgi:hypothetical protein